MWQEQATLVTTFQLLLEENQEFLLISVYSYEYTYMDTFVDSRQKQLTSGKKSRLSRPFPTRWPEWCRCPWASKPLLA